MLRMLSSFRWCLFLAVWVVTGGTDRSAIPVSYGRQIAPLLSLRCTACHSISNPSSNFRVTQYESLMAGGNIGDDIVPGHPDASSLMEFIEGKRGPGQRMPQDSRPLDSADIELVRRWISEGAKNDHAESSCFEMKIEHVLLSANLPLEIAARVLSPALVTLTLRNIDSGRELYVEEASVNSPRERANIAAPGEWIHWHLNREQGWPDEASLMLRLQYSTRTLQGSELKARGGNGRQQHTAELNAMSCLSR